MVKVNRNQPCPCGSGKKYKHCCGKMQDLNEYRKSVMDQETNALLDRTYHKFASEWFERIPGLLIHLLGERLVKLPGISQQLDHLFQEPLDGVEAEVLELMNEYILFDYEIEPGVTIFKQYFTKEMKKLRPLVAESVSLWGESYVSVYEISGIEMLEEAGVMTDIFTGVAYPVDFRLLNTHLEVEVGDLIVCRLLIKGERYDVTGYLLLAEAMREELIRRVSAMKAQKVAEGLTEWASFLKRYGYEMIVTAFEIMEEALNSFFDELYNVEEKLTWGHEKYQEVARMVRACLTEEEYQAEDIYTAIMIWHEFCIEKHPKVTKVETIVASIEYIISHATGGHVTQKEVAAKYGVSPTTVSVRVNEIAAEFVRWQEMHNQSQ